MFYAESCFDGSWDEIDAVGRGVGGSVVLLVADARGGPVVPLAAGTVPIVVIGNEARGVTLPNHLTDRVRRISVPILTESLNVACAASVLMYAL